MPAPQLLVSIITSLQLHLNMVYYIYNTQTLLICTYIPQHSVHTNLGNQESVEWNGGREYWNDL